MARVPFGVRVLATLAVFGGAFGVLVGLGLAGVGGLSWLTGMLTVSRGARYWGGSAFWGGVVSVSVGVVWIITGFGLAAARHWAWVLALVVSLLMAVPSLIALVEGQILAIFGLVIPIIVIVYLLRAEVRAAFRPRHAPNPTM
jgi:hypothetical protein